MGKGFTLEVPVNVPANMPWVSRVKIGFHLGQIALTFLTICIIAPLISTENKYYGGSQPGPNYTLVMSIFSIGIPVILLFFPWSYEHKNKFKKLGKFALKPRTNMIFTSFNSVVWLTCSIAMTVHSNNPSHCALDSKLQKEYGDDYINAWATQCNLGKAGAAFAWLTCIMWIGSWICTMIIFWNEKQLIQESIKENKQNRLSAMEQQDEYKAHDMYGDEENRMGGMQPQTLDQARALHSITPPQQHQLPPHHYEPSPFEDPSYYQPPAPHSGTFNPPAGGFPMPQPTHYSSASPDHRF